VSEEKTCDACNAESCSSRDPQGGPSPDCGAMAARLAKIAHTVFVLSGKGGVGKSTVAANLAVSLARRGLRTGLMDIDLHGPSIPRMLALQGHALESDGHALQPAAFGENLKVVSVGFLVQDPDEALIWRGPVKMGVIRQFLTDVAWGELDWLVVDSPPGTGDEPLSLCQLIPNADGAVVVTTPQDVAVADVRKCITFCGKLDLPVLGVVENMSGFACPHCQGRIDLFPTGGGQRMAQEMNVPFLGAIPLDPDVVASGDNGTPFAATQPNSPTPLAFDAIVSALLGGNPF